MAFAGLKKQINKANQVSFLLFDVQGCNLGQGRNGRASVE